MATADVDAAVVPNVADDVAAREERRVIRGAVEKLDDRYRLPILLYYFEGLSTRETADALGITQTAVTTRLSRAVTKLRDRLGRDGAILAGVDLPAILCALRSQAGHLSAPASLSAALGHLAHTAPLPAVQTASGLAGAWAAALQAKGVAATLALLLLAAGARSRVSRFYGGVYKRFALHASAAGRFTIRVERNYSHSAVLSGVFLDP